MVVVLIENYPNEWQLTIGWEGVVWQTGIYKLSFTGPSQSNFPMSVPSLLCPYYPLPPSLLSSHISKLPVSPALMPLIHPLQYVVLVRSCHFMLPTPESLSPAPCSSRDGPRHTHMLPSITYFIFQQGSIQLLSLYLCLLPHHPVHR